jgi:AcrR family transcriptional regulator
VPADGAQTARQREILATARRLLREEGPDGITVGRLAAELGIRPPSLYKHFDGKRDLEARLIAQGLEAAAEAMEQAGDDLAEIAAAYRSFAVAEPALYRLMTEGPLPRDLLPEGLEARAGAPIARAAGDPDLARAAWAFAHGMTQLELAGRFPPGADLDAAWSAGIGALRSSPAAGGR